MIDKGVERAKIRRSLEDNSIGLSRLDGQEKIIQFTAAAERSLMATVAEGVSPLAFSFRCSSTTQFSIPLMANSFRLAAPAYLETP